MTDIAASSMMFLGSPILGPASFYVIRILKQPCREAHKGRNVPPTVRNNLPACDGATLEQNSPTPIKLLVPAALAIIRLQPHKKLKPEQPNNSPVPSGRNRRRYSSKSLQFEMICN
jgi:hypothetical protein